MPLFRKKPIEIEARQLLQGDGLSLMEWCGAILGPPSMDPELPPTFDIPTLEGVMRADYGDWIIKGVAGEFYPCKPAIFEATYEEVE